MSMLHLCSGHEGLMSCDGCDGALEFGKNFWHASHVVMSFDVPFMIECQ
jgi:hypothetical protein